MDPAAVVGGKMGSREIGAPGSSEVSSAHAQRRGGQVGGAGPLVLAA